VAGVETRTADGSCAVSLCSAPSSQSLAGGVSGTNDKTYVGATLRSPGNDANTHSSRSPAFASQRSAVLTRLTLEMGSPSFRHTWLALSGTSAESRGRILSRDTEASMCASWSSSSMFRPHRGKLSGTVTTYRENREAWNRWMSSLLRWRAVGTAVTVGSSGCVGSCSSMVNDSCVSP
jgi:hypothetical protein